MKKHNGEKLYLIYRYYLDSQDSRIPPLLTGSLRLFFSPAFMLGTESKFYDILVFID